MSEVEFLKQKFLAGAVSVFIAGATSSEHDLLMLLHVSQRILCNRLSCSLANLGLVGKVL